MSDGNNAELSVAIAAMVIALTAFVVACAQLLQQIFGAADGLRRCQPSIIGDWYKLVSLNWKWSQFRFEVKFKTPHFVIGTLDQKGIEIQSGKLRTGRDLTARAIALTGTNRSRAWSFMPPVFDEGSSKTSRVDEAAIMGEGLASWVIMLNRIHEEQMAQLIDTSALKDWVEQRSKRPPPTSIWKPQLTLEEHWNPIKPLQRATETVSVMIKLRGRSWDFMPPEILRPVATCSLGTIVVMAHRMGMSWKSLNLENGSLRADGNRQSLSGTEVRGFGIVMTYASETFGMSSRSKDIWSEDTLGSSMSSKRVCVSSSDADKFGCGMIPGASNLSLWDFDLTGTSKSIENNFTNIASDLTRMGVTEAAITSLKASLTNYEDRLPIFADLFGLWSDWLPLRNSPITSVIYPFQKSVTSILATPQIAQAWRKALLDKKSESTITAQQHRVLSHLDSWESDHHQYFYEQQVQKSEDGKIMPYFKALKEAFDETTKFFERKATEFLSGKELKLAETYYSRIVACHLSVLLESKHAKDSNVVGDLQELKAIEQDLEAKRMGLEGARAYKRKSQIELDNLTSKEQIKAIERRISFLDRDIHSRSVQMDEVEQRRKKVRARIDGSAVVDKVSLRADSYVRSIKVFGQRMVSEGFLNQEENEDAYWMLILRGMAWSRSVKPLHLDDAETIPSAYYWSTTPLYIM